MKHFKNPTEISHIEKTIYLTKKFYRKACILNTSEYNQFLQMRRDNPDYKIEVQEYKKNTDKQTYRNLTIPNMEVFIRNSQKDPRKGTERIAEFETMKQLSKAQRSPYTYMKKWFLEKYGKEYNKYADTKDVNSKDVNSKDDENDNLEEENIFEQKEPA